MVAHKHKFSFAITFLKCVIERISLKLCMYICKFDCELVGSIGNNIVLFIFDTSLQHALVFSKEYIDFIAIFIVFFADFFVHMECHQVTVNTLH